RGDLVAVAVYHTSCSLAGYERAHWTTYLLGVVESVTRAGWVKALRDARGTLHRATGDYYPIATLIPAGNPAFLAILIPAGKLAFPAADVLGRIDALLRGSEVRTLDELRALVAPWVIEGHVTPWPDGLGWDVDRHHVVRVGRSLRVALCGLPDGV